MKISSRLIICLVASVLVFVSCSNDQINKQSEVEHWKLGWRMIESSMKDSLELANAQFDSLLKYNLENNRNFLIAGLEVKSELEKIDELSSIISQLPNERLLDICQSDFLRSFEKCKSIPSDQVENHPLRLELVKMYIYDQYTRSNLMEDMLTKYNLKKEDVIIDTLVESTDERNKVLLQQIIEEHGFPTKKLVGKDGMDAVFIIIQHADRDKEWQSKQLPLIEKAVQQGDLDGSDYAYLYDRIKVNAGEKQLYGTQFSNVDIINRVAELAEVEDRENLNQRRREIGLMPIEMYQRFIFGIF